MNIKEFAKKARLTESNNDGIRIEHGYWVEELTRFAALVAAHEREECAKVVELVAAQTRARCIELVLAGSSMPIQTRTMEALQRDRKRIAKLIEEDGKL